MRKVFIAVTLWSSTSLAPIKGLAWDVHFDIGYVGNLGARVNLGYVRAVCIAP